MSYFNKLEKKHLILALLLALFLFSDSSGEEISQNPAFQPSQAVVLQHPKPEYQTGVQKKELQPAAGLSAQDKSQAQQKILGELFGMPVPEGNYFIVQGAITVFGNRLGPEAKTPEEKENYIWGQLLLSYEAFRRGIDVSHEELAQEAEKILKQENVQFDFKSDKEAYEKWAREKINVSSALFENMLRHLLQVEKLRQQVMESIEPPVSRQEAFDEFLKEYNTLSVELILFNERKGAENFYKSARQDPKFWDEEKVKRPGDFKRPGLVSTEFLMDIWRFRKEDCLRMMKEKIAVIYGPFPIYKGYALAKVLEKRPAEKKEFEKVRKSYYEQVKRRKRYQALDQWFKDLKKQAGIKIYQKEG